MAKFFFVQTAGWMHFPPAEQKTGKTGKKCSSFGQIYNFQDGNIFLCLWAFVKIEMDEGAGFSAALLVQWYAA